MDKVTQIFDEIEADLNARETAGEPIRLVVVDSISSPVLDKLFGAGFKPGELAVIYGPPGNTGKIDMLQLWDRAQKARS